MIYALLHGLYLGLDLILILGRTSSTTRMIILLLKGSRTLNIGLVSRHSSISDDYSISVFLVAWLLARGSLRSDTSSRRLSQVAGASCVDSSVTGLPSSKRLHLVVGGIIPLESEIVQCIVHSCWLSLTLMRKSLHDWNYSLNVAIVRDDDWGILIQIAALRARLPVTSGQRIDMTSHQILMELGVKLSCSLLGSLRHLLLLKVCMACESLVKFELLHVFFVF